MKTTFEGARAYRPNPRIRALSWGSVVVGLLIGVAAIELGPEILVASVLLVGLGLAGFVVGRSTEMLALRSSEPIAAAREGLYEGERLIVGRDQVRAALTGRHHSYGPVLALLRGSDVVLVETDELRTAEDLLCALQLDAVHRRIEVRFRVGVGTRLLTLMLVAVVAILVAWLFRAPRLVVLTAVIVFVSNWHARLVVGDDGLALRTLWRERFASYAEIQGVGFREMAVGPHVCIALRSGREVRLAPSEDLRRRVGLEKGEEAVLERVQAALERYRMRAARAPVLPLSLSARTTGSPADRVRALTKKEQGGDVYRLNAPDADALRQAVDEPTLPPRVRAEAAIMLGAAGDADDLERLRRAAERSACRPLRELFESVAVRADEATLARALGRVA